MVNFITSKEGLGTNLIGNPDSYFSLNIDKYTKTCNQNKDTKNILKRIRWSKTYKR